MVLQFQKMAEAVSTGVRGGEGELIGRKFEDQDNKISVNRLTPGSSIGYHQHTTNCEIIYILEGVATFTDDGETVEVGPGEAQYCARGHWHGMKNNTKEDIVFIGIIPELTR